MSSFASLLNLLTVAVVEQTGSGQTLSFGGGDNLEISKLDGKEKIYNLLSLPEVRTEGTAIKIFSSFVF